MLNRAAATHNLAVLYRDPAIETLQVVDERLIPGSLSTEQRTVVLEVIRRTFALAAKLEASPLPLRVKIAETKDTFGYVSPGCVLASLPAELVAEVQTCPLPSIEEIHERGELECCEHLIPVDLQIVCGISPYLQGLFQSIPPSDQPKRVVLDCSLNILRNVIDWLHGAAPLPQFQCTAGVLEVANLLSIPALNTALSKQWQRDDYEIDQLLLFLNWSPNILLILLQGMKKTKRLEILSRLLNRRDDQDPHTIAPLTIKNLLAQSLNSQAIDFSDLIHLGGGIGLLHDRFSSDFFNQIEVLILINSPNMTSGELYSILLKCPNLRLFAPPSSIAGDFLDYLEHLPHLTVLILDDCRYLNPDCLKNLQHVPNLTRLSAKNCSQLHSLGHIQSVRKLEFLNLMGCTSLIPELLRLSVLKNLRVLNIGELTKFPFDPSFFQNFPDLQMLDLSYSALPSDFLSLLKHTSQLLYLNVEGCSGFTPDSWTHLQSVQTLTHLNISDCDNLPPNTWKSLQPIATKLQHLGVIDCENLPPDFYHFLNQCHSLRHLAIRPQQIPGDLSIKLSVKQVQRWPDYLRKPLYTQIT